MGYLSILPSATGIELSNFWFRSTNCQTFILPHCRIVQTTTKELEGLESKEVSKFLALTLIHVGHGMVSLLVAGTTHTKYLYQTADKK